MIAVVKHECPVSIWHDIDTLIHSMQLVLACMKAIRQLLGSPVYAA